MRVVNLSNKMAECRLIQAYLELYLVAPGEDGAKIISLARFGSYEVRIFEFSRQLAGDVPRLWIELYAHHLGYTIDSSACDELETSVVAADALISQARQLHLCDG